jgi:hypothetical protein
MLTKAYLSEPLTSMTKHALPNPTGRRMITINASVQSHRDSINHYGPVGKLQGGNSNRSDGRFFRPVRADETWPIPFRTDDVATMATFGFRRMTAAVSSGQRLVLSP